MSEPSEVKLERMDNLAVQAEDLGIKFPLRSQRQRKLWKIFSRVQKAGSSGEFWALREVSFSLRHGELLGVIGKNGSGKTTLLRTLAGILHPDEGAVDIWGRVGTMLSLGAGFNPDLAGHDNILLNGLVLGLTREEIDRKMEEIVAFAELDEFIHRPLKTYSSGMKARLGFSVAASIDADVLLVDEILSVGDESFRAKSYARMMEIYNSGRTVVFASHSLDKLAEICTRVIWLNKGRVCFDGDPYEAVDQYREFVRG